MQLKVISHKKQEFTESSFACQIILKRKKKHLKENCCRKLIEISFELNFKYMTA